MKSKVNWRAVHSDVAQIFWGVIVYRPVMADNLVMQIERIVKVRFPRI